MARCVQVCTETKTGKQPLVKLLAQRRQLATFENEVYSLAQKVCNIRPFVERELLQSDHVVVG